MDLQGCQNPAPPQPLPALYFFWLNSRLTSTSTSHLLWLETSTLTLKPLNKGGGCTVHEETRNLFIRFALAMCMYKEALKVR